MEFREIFVIGAGLFSIFLSAATYSLQGPFFPAEAERKGLTPFEYGFVFSAFELFVFLSSMPIGRLISKIGAKPIVVSGSGLLGISLIGFGFLHYISNKMLFLVLCILARILEAVSESAVMVGVLTILPTTFPAKADLMLSWGSAAGGVGFLCGPVIGGPIYDKWGYVSPFLTVGCGLLLLMFVNILSLPKEKKSKPNQNTTKKISVINVLRIPNLWYGLPVYSSAACAMAMMLALTEPHLRPLGLSGTLIGLVFMVQGLTYVLVTPLFGFLVHRGIHPILPMAAGLIVFIIGLSMIGPLPFINDEPTLFLALASFVLAGLGLGGIMTPANLFIKRVSIPPIRFHFCWFTF